MVLQDAKCVYLGGKLIFGFYPLKLLVRRVENLNKLVRLNFTLTIKLILLFSV